MRHLRLPKAVTAADLSVAIYGSWDGCISVLAVLVASSHLGPRQLLVAGVGGSVGGAFSMATGQYESLDATHNGREKIRLAVLMAIFTLIGGLLYALPFVAGKTFGYVVGTALTIGLATLVWVLKKEGPIGAVRAYALLAVTAVATIAVSLVMA